MLNDEDKLRAYDHLEDLVVVQPEISRVLAARLDPTQEPNIAFRLRIGEIVLKARPGIEELAFHHGALKQLLTDSLVKNKTSIIGTLIGSPLRNQTLKGLKALYMEGKFKDAAGAVLKLVKKAEALQIENPFALSPDEWKSKLNNRQAA